MSTAALSPTSTGRQMARVAHELRTPVSLISGSLENLQDSLATLVRYVEATDKYLSGSEEISRLRADLRLERRLADTVGLLAICAEGARRLSHVVDQMRATVPHGAALAGQPSDLRAVVDTASAMAAYGRGSHPPVVTDFDPPRIAVLGSAQSLGQVFLNLIRNAFDALDGHVDGRVDLEARLHDGADGAKRVTVVVRDNGPGIPPENRERIFDELFSTKGEGGGLGLGLSISREILAAMGGSIRLLSQGRGAAFAVDLPVVAGTSNA